MYSSTTSDGLMKSLKATRRRILHLVLCLAITMICMNPAFAQDPDLDSNSSVNETIPAGSLVIPMDNTLQSAGSKAFNISAYGIAVHLLHANIPVKWAIANNKAKDAVDFSATAHQVEPTVGSSERTDSRSRQFQHRLRRRSRCVARRPGGALPLRRVEEQAVLRWPAFEDRLRSGMTDIGAIRPA